MGSFLLILTTILIFWVLPLILGLNLATKKGITRKWMLFAIHPFFAWIGYLIISLKTPKRECPHCYNQIDTRADICSYCLTEVEPLNPLKKSKPLHTYLAILFGISFITSFFLILTFGIAKAFKDSWAYQEAWTRLENDPAAASFLGGSLENTKLGINGRTSEHRTSLSIPLKGAKGIGKMRIGAHQYDGQWYMDTLWLIDFGSGDTIDLSDQDSTLGKIQED